MSNTFSVCMNNSEKTRIISYLFISNLLFSNLAPVKAVIDNEFVDGRGSGEATRIAHRWNSRDDVDEEGVTYRGLEPSEDSDCKLCLPDDGECLPFDPVKCEYYLETNKILASNDWKNGETQAVTTNPTLRAEVDSLLYDVIETATSEALLEECIPYVSRYTDCNKENICVGCQTCDCNSESKWNCSIVQSCRPELVGLEADQATLLAAIGKLKNSPETLRHKRSVFHSMHSSQENNIEEKRFRGGNKNKYDDWEDEEPSLDMQTPHTFHTTFLENELRSTTGINLKKGKELIKLIVSSLLKDTLPDVFRENKFEKNIVKRWVTYNKTEKELNDADAMTDANQPMTLHDVNSSRHKNKITFEEISGWLNEIHPLEERRQGEIEPTKSTVQESSNFSIVPDSNDTVPGAYIPTASKNVTSMTSNPDYIAFEEVYKNIQFDNKTYTRRKPPLDHTTKYNTDYEFDMYDDKYFNAGSVNITPETTLTNTGREQSEGTTEYSQYASKVVVDLLKTAKNTDLDHDIENIELNNNKIEEDRNSAVYIMKRDVSSSHKYTNLKNVKDVNSTKTLKHNKTLNNKTQDISHIKYLKEGVLDPLDSILKYKHTEEKELLDMRNRLIKYMHSFADYLKLDISKTPQLYQYEFLQIDHNTTTLEPKISRRSNVTLLDKYKVKLKRDIYEVIRDIIAIRKFYDSNLKFPVELNFLIRSLKHYIHKSNFGKKETIKNTRRSNNAESTVKNVILRIFELLVRNTNNTNYLKTLSPSSENVVKRLIKNNYVDDFAASGLRIYDPHYNLTNDLQNIGSEWSILTSIIKSCPVSDKLSSLKRLHLAIAVDVSKLNDAIALLDFAKTRRMSPIDEVGGNFLATNINKILEKMRNNIEDVSSTYFTKTIVNTNNAGSEEKRYFNEKKHSFLSQIRNLIRKSKNNIAKLLHRKVPKTKILKRIAKENVEMMTRKKLQDTMKKWQTDLNIVPTRNKRSNNDHKNRRMASIIPKYLRGKVPSEYAKSKKGKKKNSTIGLTRKETEPSTAKLKTNESKTGKFNDATITSKAKFSTTGANGKIKKPVKTKKSSFSKFLRNFALNKNEV